MTGTLTLNRINVTDVRSANGVLNFTQSNDGSVTFANNVTIPGTVTLAGNTSIQASLDAKSNVLQPLTTIAAAATTNLGSLASEGTEITGTATITSLGTSPAGTRRTGRVTGTPTFTHNATSLICIGGANIVATAGDLFDFISLGSGNWLMLGYCRANGTALVNAGAPLPITGTGVGQVIFTGYTGMGAALLAPAGGTWLVIGTRVFDQTTEREMLDGRILAGGATVQPAAHPNQWRGFFWRIT